MRKLLFLLMGLSLLTNPLLAQDRTIAGKLTDAAGNAVAGASVSAKGVPGGVSTKEDGSFTIKVAANTKTLIISSIGYATSEVALGNSNNITVTIQTTDQALSEVVVVGYGTQKRADVTSAISTIGGDKIKDLPVQSFDQALAGKASGLNITMPNGQLNNPPVIRIRGTNSISLSSYPLVVVDGVPIRTGDASTTQTAANTLSNINPADIEDIQVLKDAAAAAIYGSRAANGVMIITTKKGKSGKPRVNYDSWIGSTEVFRIWDVLDAPQYVTIKNEARANAGLAPAFFLDSINGKMINTNWNDYIYRNGFQHNHNFSVSGANAGTRYYMSAGYTNQEGMIRTNDFERKQMRMNLEQKVNDWLKVGTNMNYTRSINRAPNTGSVGNGFNTSGIARLGFVSSPIVGPYLADGTYNIMTPNDPVGRNTNNQLGRGKNLDRTGFTNPVLLLDLNKFSTEADQFLGNAFAELTLYKGLKFRTQYGVDYTLVEDKTFQNALHGDGLNTTAITDDGSASNTNSRNNNKNWQNILTYDFNVQNRHSFSLLAGHEEQHNTTDRWGALRWGVTDMFFNEFQGGFSLNQPPVNNSLTENFLMGFFGRVNYNLDNKYFLSGNVRRDGYSAFAPGKKWGNFGGASAGWNISSENFWTGGISKVINNLKLRGGYGLVGNTGVGNFAALSIFSSGVYGLGDPTLFFNQAGNTDLTWEKNYKSDIGIQFGLFKDRITGEFGYYNSTIEDLILSVPTAPSMGIPGNSISANTAEMYNRGFELQLTGKIIEKKNVQWSTTLNLTTQKNRVVKLATGVNEIIHTTGGLERTNITRPGYAVGSIFGVITDGVDPATGRRIFLNGAGQQVFFDFSAASGQRFKFADGTIAPDIDLVKDAKILGSGVPTVYGGLINNFSYKNFDLVVDAIFAAGHKIYNGSQAGMRDQRFWNNSTDVLRRWQKPGDITDIPRLVYNDNISNGSTLAMSSNIENGDFVKFRLLGLGYTLPKGILSALNLSSLRFFAQVQNAFIITNYSGSDPEISSNGNSSVAPGIDRNTVPQARTYAFGVNVGF
jgi:TonB-dependent starch-binding outer membrane protein SusC